MNLYGNDMDESISPLEAGLGWTIAWEPEERDFIGRSLWTSLEERAPLVPGACTELVDGW